MEVRGIVLATEDELSGAIGCRLIEDSRFAGSSLRKLRRDGAGYLYSGMDKWRQVAARQPVLIITDLDDRHCPLALLEDWRGTRGVLPDNLLLRVAVREIESWVMADHEGMRSLIGNKGKLPPEPDLLPDPKSHLLKLAEYAPRAIRVDLVIKKGAKASQGLGYNARLTEWVRTVWSPERAAQRSPSLARARRALARL